MPARSWTRLLASAAVLGAGCLAACGGSAESAEPPEGARGDAAPSRQAASICEKMVRDGIEEIVDGGVVGAPRATRADPTYECRYRLTDGSIQLTVENFETPAKAQRELERLLADPDVREELPGLAHGGLWRTNGNLDLAKDEYVLTIDVTRLNALDNKHAASLRIAEAVLGCW
jgi:hypothetical protein